MDAKPVQWDKLASAMHANGHEESYHAYTNWANEYDADVHTLGNLDVFYLVRNIIGNIKNDESALLLDLAAGTGRVGQELRDCGYKGIMDAVDINEAMLKQAEEKRIYRKCICSEVSPGQPILHVASLYDTVTISGSFHDNHLHQDSLKTIIGYLKPCGILVYNTRMAECNRKYREKLEEVANELEEAGEIELIETKENLQYKEKNEKLGGIMRMRLYIYKKL